MAKAQVQTRIYSRFSTPDSAPVEFGVSMTQQHFKDECDINNILKSYRGKIPASEEPAFFMDCTVNDLQSAYEIAEDIGSRFDSLDSEVRAKFNNNPLELLEFVHNADNQTAAIELGLLPKPAPVEPTPVEPTPAPPAPEPTENS
nr:MAG TPA: Scaffold protein [Microviridae sp.]